MLGLLRVKNEARWIQRCLTSIAGLCSRIVVLDDHSTDGTPDLARDCGAEVLISPFKGLNETRDKNHLLEHARPAPGGWVLMIDGDEALHPDDAKHVYAATMGRFSCYTLRVLYLWDNESSVRVDGVYGRFTRPSLFRYRPGAKFRATRNGGNFHCGNTPNGVGISAAQCDARLLHYGYLDRADRIRKFHWYREQDPGNIQEDEYRHIAQGDIPEIPASVKLRHAGPLTLQSL